MSLLLVIRFLFDFCISEAEAGIFLSFSWERSILGFPWRTTPSSSPRHDLHQAEAI